MVVPKNIQDRVVAKLRDCIAVAEKHYKTTFRMPRIKYQKRGTTAGTADYREWVVDFNAALLIDNVDDFIDETVPHELAHLINHQVYPESHKSAMYFDGVQFRRTKREVHGTTWQSVMRVLGVPPSRCHQYDTSAVKQHKPKYAYQCNCCGQRLEVGPKINANIKRGKTYRHNGCKNSKIVPLIQQPSPTNVAPVVMPTVKTQHPKYTTPTAPVAGVSKMDTCKMLYRQNPAATRAKMISLFVELAGCTLAGASTYYQKLKNM